MTWPVFGWSKNSVMVRLVPQIEMVSIHKAWWKCFFLPWILPPDPGCQSAPGIWNTFLDSGIPISFTLLPLMIPPVMKLEDLNILWTARIWSSFSKGSVFRVRVWTKGCVAEERKGKFAEIVTGTWICRIALHSLLLNSCSGGRMLQGLLVLDLSRHFIIFAMLLYRHHVNREC